jgi:phosphopentomutase
MIVTADHGNDPTFRGTDHTREMVPLLTYGPSFAQGRSLGVRETFADVAATLAEFFDLGWSGSGSSFLPEIRS